MATSQEGSTNNTQEENNIKDLGGKEAIEKLRSLAEKAESCFFCTNNLSSIIKSHFVTF
ncbi:hypothetical protein [Pedobacter borealis]|uniref:hypothetical protein n=1 Tax=Pedobacter borealis TaxID=475254 RepID=UPI000A5780BB|nr:hypothetical protein [Pedobacter borealis]